MTYFFSQEQVAGRVGLRIVAAFHEAELNCLQGGFFLSNHH